MCINRLSAIAYNKIKIHFTYDLEGRRLSKEITRNGTLFKKAYYIYVEDQEIATQDEERNFKQLRILGKESRSIAIETPKGTFAPIHSFNDNILKLINCSTKEIIDYSNLDPFGSNLKQLVAKKPITPWVYASKHYDLESGLVYFGQRYYDPDIKRWLNLDPMGRIQTANLYNYDFNNPLLFIDIDGTSAFSLAIPIIKWGGKKAAIAMIPGFGQAATFIGLGWTIYEGAKLGYTAYKNWKDQNKKPPYDGRDLGNDPSRCPGKGFEWKGRGTPGSGQGSWVKGPKGAQEKLYPDINHPDPIGPHWDYEGPGFETGVRLFPDGTWSVK